MFCNQNRDQWQPDVRERGRLNLLQQFKVYKVETADMSMVFDRHAVILRSDSVDVLMSTNESGRTQMKNNDVVTSAYKCPTPPPPIDFERDAHTKAKKAAEAFNSKRDCAQSQALLTNQQSTKASTLQPPIQAAPLQMIRRRKSTPRHRCNSLNRSLSSILKPSFHSFSKKDERLTKSLPPNWTPELTSHVLDDAVVDEGRLCDSILRHSVPYLDSGISWVPKGVHFCSNVEVSFYHAEAADLR